MHVVMEKFIVVHTVKQTYKRQKELHNEFNGMPFIRTMIGQFPIERREEKKTDNNNNNNNDGLCV